MIEILKKYKVLLIIIAVLIMAFVGYSIFYPGGDEGSVLTSQNGNIKSGGGENELLILLINLRSITLSNSLFSDPAFNRLVDFGQKLIPEPVGRDNPFAPVGSDGI
jgi:hypothetical protein